MVRVSFSVARFPAIAQIGRTVLVIGSCVAIAACAGGEPDGSTATQSGSDSLASVVITHPAQTPDPHSGSQAHEAAQPPASQAPTHPPPPRILSTRRHLQCVPYARELANIQIRGDAWTWWRTARGRFKRGSAPEIGAVLVLKRRGRSRGHVAVVTNVLNDREIVVSHANWLNRGRIHLNTPVRDESPANDWSRVRVWYTPGSIWGKSTYPAYGFIYPRIVTAAK